jgi:hypothetical protein
VKRFFISVLIVLFFFSTHATSSPRKKILQWHNVSGYTYSYEKLGLLAFQEVCWDWRPLGWTIEFLPGIENYLGTTDMINHKISIYVRPEHSPGEVAATLVHELSHAFDYIYLNPEIRAQWLEIRKLPGDTPWDPPCEDCTDFEYGTGDFAESVSWTFQGPEAGFMSKLGPPPNRKQQAFIFRLVQHQ